jgi:hypothetical protein
MMPKNPQNIVANMQASNTGIACWIKVEGKRKNKIRFFYLILCLRGCFKMWWLMYQKL